MATPPTQQPPLPLDYSNEGTAILIFDDIMAALATIVFAMRLVARRLTRVRLGLDDYLAGLALIMHHGLVISGHFSVLQGGLGQDMRVILQKDPNSLVILFKTLFISEIFYGFSSPLIKLSVLAFYWRLFPSKSLRRSCIVLAGICIAWMIAITVTTCLQCRPLRAAWHIEMQTMPGTTCIDTLKYFLGNGIANCIIDAATVVLPLREVWALQMNMKRKLGLCVVFLFGILTFAASLVRVISTAVVINEGLNNFTRQFVLQGTATTAEVYVGIIGACLPLLRPLWHRLRGKRSSPTGSGKTFSSDEGAVKVHVNRTIGSYSTRKRATSDQFDEEETSEELCALRDMPSHRSQQSSIRTQTSDWDGLVSYVGASDSRPQQFRYENKIV